MSIILNIYFLNRLNLFCTLFTDVTCNIRPIVEAEEVVLKPNELKPATTGGGGCVSSRDLRDLDLELDEVPNSVVTLSASRLRLLQDTTMIESALDLDSLEESTSSMDTGSQAGLLKAKEVH